MRYLFYGASLRHRTKSKTFQLEDSYFLCFVVSSKTYRWPGARVGGNGSPRVTVTSVRVVVFRYCPEVGALVPGVKVGRLVGIHRFHY